MRGVRRPLPAARPAQGLPEGPRLRLARAEGQGRGARGDTRLPRRGAAEAAAGRRDRARTRAEAHRRGCDALPGLQGGQAVLRRAAPAREERAAVKARPAHTPAFPLRALSRRGGETVPGRGKTAPEPAPLTAGKIRKASPQTVSALRKRGSCACRPTGSPVQTP